MTQITKVDQLSGRWQHNARCKSITNKQIKHLSTSTWVITMHIVVMVSKINYNEKGVSWNESSHEVMWKYRRLYTARQWPDSVSIQWIIIMTAKLNKSIVTKKETKKRKEEQWVTLTKPVRRLRFKCRFLISPYSPKAFCKSSSCASSCTPVTRMIHPSMARTSQTKHT